MWHNFLFQMYTINIPELVQTRETVLVYPGGYVRPPQTIFEELLILRLQKKKDTILGCLFDFEAILQRMTVKAGKQTVVTQEHKPVSVSVAINVKQSECDHNSHNEEWVTVGNLNSQFV